MKDSDLPIPEEIALSQIDLDTENPRHDKLGSQIEIIDWMTSGNSKVGNKVLNLAKDIVAYGLNPGERLFVIRNNRDENRFIVIEGNRRIAALKLIKNPDSAPSDKWKKKFEQVITDDYTPIKKVPCVVFPDRESADHFIEIKHLGESDGAGVVPWDAIQKTRHEQRKSGSSRYSGALALLGYVQESELFNEDVKEAASKPDFPISTLQRLVSAKDFRDFWGVETKPDGTIQFDLDTEEVSKPLSKVIRDFGTGAKHVGDVINKKKREEYKQEFTPSEVADHTKRLKSPAQIRPNSADSSKTDNVSVQDARPSRYVNPLRRKTVVVKGDHIPIDTKRFNRARRLFEELRDLELQDKDGKPKFPNAAILLCRTFIEVSVDIYIKEKNLSHSSPNGWSNIKLTERIKSVLKDIEKKHPEHAKTYTVINKALGDQQKIAHPNSIHDMVHNHRQIPAPSDVISIWDIYSHFLLLLWNEL